MKYKIYIFDLDGTVLDNSANIISFINLTLNDFGLPSITLEDCLQFIGPPLQETLKKNFNMSDEQANEAAQVYKNHSQHIDPRKIHVYEGLRELLIKLKQNGAKTAISTLKIDSIAKQLLNKCGLDSYLDCIMGNGVDGKLTKAQLIQKSLEHLNVKDLSNVVMIGDTKFDENGAKEVGVDFIGVTYGFGFKNEDGNPNRVSNIKELERIIFES